MINIKKKFNIIIPFFLLIFMLSASAQNGSQLYEGFTPSSPNVAEFQKYGNTQMNLSIGRKNLDIPILSLNARGYKLDIGLTYNSGGISVAELGSWVGMGWLLNAGGIITRQPVSKADESYNGNGFFTYCEDVQLIEGLWSFEENEDGTLELASSGNIDFEPDVFSYTIGNISGKFFLDCSQNAIHHKHTNIKIEIVDEGDYGITKWKIIDEEGTTYLFEDYELTSPNNHNISTVCGGGFGSANTTEPYQINSWHLTKIITSLNDTITFTYETHFSENNILLRDIALISFDDNLSTIGWPDVTTAKGLATQTKDIVIIAKKLKNIVVSSSGQSIGFSFSRRMDLPYYTPESELQREDYKLDDIVLSDPYCSSRKHFSFNYKYLSQEGVLVNNPTSYNDDFRLILTDFNYISTNDSNTYFFDYYLKNDSNLGMPPRKSFAVDYLGYFNGQITNNTFLEKIITNEFQEYVHSYHRHPVDNGTQWMSGLFSTCVPQLVVNRSPNLSSARVGSLQKITYPTGGSSVFNYEFSTTDEQIKALRISSIIDIDGNNDGLIRRFEYSETPLFTMAKEFSTVSQYTILFLDSPTHRLRTHTYVAGSPYAINYHMGSPFIYHKVIEFQEDIKADGTIVSNGKIEYNYDNTKDLINIEMDNWVVMYDESWKRGTLISKKVYDADDNLIQEEVYNYITSDDYNSFPYNLVLGKEVTGVKFEEYYRQTEGWGVNPLEIDQRFRIAKYLKKTNLSLLNSKATFSYFENGDSISQLESYVYDDKGNLSERILTNSDNSNLNTTYKYPYDYGQSFTYRTLKAKNRISKPVEITNFVNGSVVGSTITTYGCSGCVNIGGILEGGIVLPIRQYAIETNIPLVDFQETSTSVTLDNRYKLNITFDKYDPYGNLLQYHKENDIPVSYIWGYNNTYPTAKIDNAKYNECFHTSFEEDPGIYAWHPYTFDSNISKTGDVSLKSEKLTSGENYFYLPMLSINNSTSKTYKYSVWVYSTAISADLYCFHQDTDDSYLGTGWQAASKRTTTKNSWVLLEGEIVVPSNKKCIYLRVDNNGGGTVWFDELRLYPIDAQMSTYTYDPLVGMTSETDSNGKTTYYVYDSFGRLYQIKDQDGNILKQYEYNYAH